jgi:hypothetical protein
LLLSSSSVVVVVVVVVACVVGVPSLLKYCRLGWRRAGRAIPALALVNAKRERLEAAAEAGADAHAHGSGSGQQGKIGSALRSVPLRTFVPVC